MNRWRPFESCVHSPKNKQEIPLQRLGEMADFKHAKYPSNSKANLCGDYSVNNFPGTRMADYSWAVESLRTRKNHWLPSTSSNCIQDRFGFGSEQLQESWGNQWQRQISDTQKCSRTIGPVLLSAGKVHLCRPPGKLPILRCVCARHCHGWVASSADSGGCNRTIHASHKPEESYPEQSKNLWICNNSKRLDSGVSMSSFRTTDKRAIRGVTAAEIYSVANFVAGDRIYMNHRSAANLSSKDMPPVIRTAFPVLDCPQTDGLEYPYKDPVLGADEEFIGRLSKKSQLQEATIRRERTRLRHHGKSGISPYVTKVVAPRKSDTREDKQGKSMDS